MPGTLLVLGTRWLREAYVLGSGSVVVEDMDE